MVLRNSFLLILLPYICKSVSGQTSCTTTSSLLADVYEYAPNGTNVLNTTFVGILGTEITLSLQSPLSDYFVLNGKVLQVADGVNITRNSGSNGGINGQITCRIVGGIALNYDVIISIQTINLNPPKFQETSYSNNISETSATANSDVLEVTATDDDVSASNIDYTISNQPPGDYFRIRGSSNGLIATGVITANKPLPYQVDPYDLTITATSTGVNNIGSPWIQNSGVNVKISVIDEDDHFPQFQPCLGDGVCAVIYTSALDTGVTKVLSLKPENITALDLDRGINALIEYSLATGFPDDYSTYFLIDSSTGAVSVITPFSAREVYTMTVEAKESSGKSSYASLRVDVNYVDNYKPNISISSTSGYLQESSTNSLAYVTIDEDVKIPLTISATDEDDDTATFYYECNPNSFQVTNDGRVFSSSGLISTFATTPTLLTVAAINRRSDESSPNKKSNITTVSLIILPIPKYQNDVVLGVGITLIFLLGISVSLNILFIMKSSRDKRRTVTKLAKNNLHGEHNDQISINNIDGHDGGTYEDIDLTRNDNIQTDAVSLEYDNVSHEETYQSVDNYDHVICTQSSAPIQNHESLEKNYISPVNAVNGDANKATIRKDNFVDPYVDRSRTNVEEIPDGTYNDIITEKNLQRVRQDAATSNC